MITDTDRPAVDKALVGMAVGRIVLGALALAAPRATARLFRISPKPDLTYMTRIFGGRAIALGLGYLTEPAAHRARWHRLGLFVDTSDTLSALAHLRRRDIPRPAVLAAGALTGTYMAIGALRLARPTSPRVGALGTPSRAFRHTTRCAGTRDSVC
ncbi:hypothetical protein [Pseudonocardia acaciae]|uniref:hypothetical protein n=1 Tax=Pseudonocardia acaciae TaxID=551276 RepID=UPI001B80AC7E|nr:hypothetical protein [Pseudonocardia acaciae]